MNQEEKEKNKLNEILKEITKKGSLNVSKSKSGQTEKVASFRVFLQRWEIGMKILNALNSKRNQGYGENERTGSEFHAFPLNDDKREDNFGLMSQLYGGNGLFSLVNRYKVLENRQKGQSENDYNNLIKGIKSVIYDVLNRIEGNGDYKADNEDNTIAYNYDFNPYGDDEINRELFRNTGLKYIGSMTWALSLFTAVARAIRDNTITFDEEIKKKTQERVYRQIKYIIRFFIDNVVVDKKTGFKGWGYANKCTESSLFFTYSVIEAYSDLEDNLMPNDSDSDEEREKKEKELLTWLNNDLPAGEEGLEKQYQAICYEIGDRTWRVYRDYVRTKFFSDRFDGTISTISESEVRNASRSTVLFNTLYVIFILFYSSTNLRTITYDGRERSEEEQKNIVATMTRGLQLVQNLYSDLKDEGKDYIVDEHIISFTQNNEKVPNFNRILNRERIVIRASGLLPMLVKANNLIAYYILKFPQKSMTEFLEDALLARNDNEWLWENGRYDLLSTERYIEAIADFFDYYDTYERVYADKDFKRDQEIAKGVEARIEQAREEIKNEIQKSVAETHRQELEDAVIAEREKYTIEPMIERKIEQVLNEKIEKALELHLVGSLKRLSEGRESAFDRELDSALMAYVKGKFRNELKDVEELSVKLADDSDEQKKFEQYITEDIREFAKNYFILTEEYFDQMGTGNRRLSKMLFNAKELEFLRLEDKKK